MRAKIPRAAREFNALRLRGIGSGHAFEEVARTTEAEVLSVAVSVAARGRFGRVEKLWPEASVTIDLVGLDLKLLGHQAQPFGTRQIEATAGNSEATIGLSAEKLGSQHGIRISEKV